MDQQAGILAQELKEGEPCPVCGSTSHPSPAAITKEAPTQKELNELEQQAKDAQTLEQDSNSECIKIKTEDDTAVKNIAEQIKKLFGKEAEAAGSDESKIEELCEQEKTRLISELDKNQTALTTAQESAAKKTEYEERQPKLEDELEQK